MLDPRTYRPHLLGLLVVLVAGTSLSVKDDAPSPIRSSSLLGAASRVSAAESLHFPPARPAPYAWPVLGPVTSFMDESHPLGIDVGLASTPDAGIGAAAGGIVTFAGGRYCCSYGYYVVVDHGNGFSTLYAHLSVIYVREGEVVSQGQILGLGGASGYSEGGAHLHFELRSGETPIDPLPLLPKHGAPEDE